MRRKYLTIIYAAYVALLFYLSSHYDLIEEYTIPKGLNGLGESLALLLRYLIIAFVSSSTFLIVACIISKRQSIVSMVMVPFLNVIVALVVALALNFFLWITQLEKTVNDFQQIFIVAVISTMITWLWLLGDLFSAVMNKSAAN